MSRGRFHRILGFWMVLLSAPSVLLGAIPHDQIADLPSGYGYSLVPYGFQEFCLREPSECQVGAIREAPSLTAKLYAELVAVNDEVNERIEGVRDGDLYGVPEYWTLPYTKGDCEDMALLKRHILIAKGWPVSSVLLTTADHYGSGHAVLTVRLAEGNLILDNKVDGVRWHDEARAYYTFLTRQSVLDPNVWVSVQ